MAHPNCSKSGPHGSHTFSNGAQGGRTVFCEGRK